MKRLPLARMIGRAWQKCICKHYVRAEINSEAALQALFCGYLIQVMEIAKPKWRLFVEPRLASLDGQSVVLPDVLICNAERVIGAIELKYKPKVLAFSDKDINTLTGLAARAGDGALCIENDRYRGPRAKRKPYLIADDALYVWAGITGKPVLNCAEERQKLQEKFATGQLLFVQAVTHKHKEPDVSSFPKISGLPDQKHDCQN